MHASSSKTSVPIASATKLTRGHSCVLCQQRKVKCDGQKPCSNCIKARVECVASAPSLPRRRKRKFPAEDVMSKLKKYEQLLEAHGIKFGDDEEADNADGSSNVTAARAGQRECVETDVADVRRVSMFVPRPQGTDKGAFFFTKESSHYVENTLWENLKDEIEYSKGSLSDDELNDTSLCPDLYPDLESLILGVESTTKDLSSHHPPPVQVFQLWQTFSVNVNPIVKIFHAPTIQQNILDATGNIEQVSRPLEALMFAVYLLAVTSSKNEDCERVFGDTRTKLLIKYSYATKQALMNAKFLKSFSLMTLQALTLYLIGIRRFSDAQSLWILTGVGVRIGQRLGLHRESANHMLSTFEAEMRRRTWWQIFFLDGHVSKLAGAGFPPWLSKFDTKPPVNVSDSELSLTMKELPAETKGSTEMIFCSMRYQVAIRLGKAGDCKSNNEQGQWPESVGSELIAQKDNFIRELEKEFDHLFVRHCDPSIPLHLLVIYVAKSIIRTMKIMAHHPRQYLDKGASMPQTEKDFVFNLCLQELEHDKAVHTIKSLQGYLWQIHSFLKLDAFIYIISELRGRTSGDLVDRAWEQVRESYEYRPELIASPRNTLHFAIGNLTLKAWAKREEAIGVQAPPPRFVSLLRKLRNISDPSRPLADMQNQITSRSPNIMPDLTFQDAMSSMYHASQWTSSMMTGFDQEQPVPETTTNEWQYWQTLMDGGLPAYSGMESMGNDWF